MRRRDFLRGLLVMPVAAAIPAIARPLGVADVVQGQMPTPIQWSVNGPFPPELLAEVDQMVAALNAEQVYGPYRMWLPDGSVWDWDGSRAKEVTG